MKHVVDSSATDLATSSGPHGISLSTTMDDEVFMDGTLREAAEKTPDSQEEVSERSLVKVSPGAVTQEVSQAISDKKGTLIILKEADDKEGAGEMSSAGAKEEHVVPREVTGEGNKSSTLKEREDTSLVHSSVTAEVKTHSPKKEIKNGDIPQNKGIDSPKKAMAAWIYEEVKMEPTEVISVTTKEVKEVKTPGSLQQIAEIFTFEEEQSKSSVAKITVSESTTTALAGVLYKY